MLIPDPDLDFLPIPDPRVKKAPDPGSATMTLGLPFVLSSVKKLLDKSWDLNCKYFVIITPFSFPNGRGEAGGSRRRGGEEGGKGENNDNVSSSLTYCGELQGIVATIVLWQRERFQGPDVFHSGLRLLASCSRVPTT
jgi:hypothetical protein